MTIFGYDGRAVLRAAKQAEARMPKTLRHSRHRLINGMQRADLERLSGLAEPYKYDKSQLLEHLQTNWTSQTTEAVLDFWRLKIEGDSSGASPKLHQRPEQAQA